MCGLYDPSGLHLDFLLVEELVDQLVCIVVAPPPVVQQGAGPDGVLQVLQQRPPVAAGPLPLTWPHTATCLSVSTEEPPDPAKTPKPSVQASALGWRCLRTVSMSVGALRGDVRLTWPTCCYGLLHLQLHGHGLHALLRVDQAAEECRVGMRQHLPHNCTLTGSLSC